MKSVTKGYGCVSPVGNGRHFTFIETCDLMEVLGSGSQKSYVADKKGWTLDCSGFLPLDSVPAVGSTTTAVCSAGGGQCIVSKVSQSADVGGIATYDITFTGI